MTESLKCGGCHRELVAGDRYIRDTASGFLDGGNPEFDGLISSILGGKDGQVIYCENCTEPGGKYEYKTFIGDAWSEP